MNWDRRPEVLDAEHRHDTAATEKAFAAWERHQDELDAVACAEAHARDWDPEDYFPDSILNGD